MNRLCFVALCLSASSVASAAPIIGGTATKVGDFPSTVAIEVGQGLCTGELIAPDWVLTAGHCVDPAEVGAANRDDLTASVKVHFNTVNIFTTAGEVATAIETFEHPMHPDFQNGTGFGKHDIGLIHLSAKITDVKPSQVNLSATDAPAGTVVTMVGFGTTQVGAQGNAGIEFVLKNRATVPCAQIPEAGTDDSGALCYSQTDSKGKCEGDSGGPSFAQVGNVTKIIGITSYGDQSCNDFGVDTRTDFEKDFLLQHVPELECTTDADCTDPDRTQCFNHTCILTPFADGAVGATCATTADCMDGTCDTGPGGMKCSFSCTPNAAGTCPDGFDCLDAGGGNGACWPQSADGGGGCCDASGKGAPTALLGIALLGFAFTRRRRA